LQRNRRAPLLMQQRSAIAKGAKDRYHSIPTTTKLRQILPTPPLRRSVAGDRPQQLSPHHSLGDSFRVDSRRALLIVGKVTLLSPTLLLSPVAALGEASKPRAGRASPTAAREVRFQNFFSSQWSNVLRGLVFCRLTFSRRIASPRGRGRLVKRPSRFDLTFSPSHHVSTAVPVPAGWRMERRKAHKPETYAACSVADTADTDDTAPRYAGHAAIPAAVPGGATVRALPYDAETEYARARANLAGR
jgi:hypothetical protein